MEPRPFVHLHTHSHYSFLDGLSKIKDLVAKAQSFGMTALALTDHGNMHGAIEFYKTCTASGIKPILGVEFYVAVRTRHDKEHGIDSKRYHLTLLAKNTQGYQNLMKLVSLSHMEGYYYKPRIDRELIARYHEGLICLSGCPASELNHYLREKRDDDARALIDFYLNTFGRENFFLEIMNHSESSWYASHVPVLEKIKKLSTEYNIPLVATWDSHYLNKDDKQTHDTLLKINTQSDSFKLDGDYSLINQEQAYEIFKDYESACAMTQTIADMVDIHIDFEPWQFPTPEIPAGSDYDTELRKKSMEGFVTRGLVCEGTYQERMEFELDIIKQKGFSSYFLVESDLVNAATRMGIYTNTRGSAAGSLVSFLTGITNIDPLRYKLPFERFLNPLRPGIPDIDLDIADDRRDDLISYMREKYGAHAVAQIGTFGTMAARGSIKDVARALGYPYSIGDRLSKMVPMGSQGFPMTIDHALEIVPELKEEYDNDPNTREIISMAKKIEGNVRHISVHAAGVVISPTGHIDDFSPVQFDPKGEGKVITQYDMYTGGRDGVVRLPKFDLLGLRNLNFIAETIDRVKKIRGEVIDIETVPIDDEKTFAMLARGETMGVFQMAGEGMTKYIKDLQPTKIEDIMAMVALYRPGPMEVIPEYIARKRNPRLVTYPDERLREDLEASYGLLVYQDDVLFTAIRLAGYNWLDADKFRKAMGKKIPAEMAEQKEKFYKGCKEHGGLETKKIDEIWEKIEPFAAYGFNKAHAASYGQLAYRTAYLKANYPAEYMTACMTAESGDIETVSAYIEEAKKMGFTILPPDINESFSDFTVVVDDQGIITKNIRFGLHNVKNFGEEIGKAIIAERKKNGRFTSIENFLERVSHRNVNKKSLEALIQCGAMDELGDRGFLLANVETMLHFHREVHSGHEHQTSLFSLGTLPKARLTLTPAEPLDHKKKLFWEKELLGLYVSGHPLDIYREKIMQSGKSIEMIKKSSQAGSTIVIAGVIEEIHDITTKKQERMSFVRISDFTGSLECIFFPQVLGQYRLLLKPENCVAIKARVTVRDGEKGFIVEEMKTL